MNLKIQIQGSATAIKQKNIQEELLEEILMVVEASDAQKLPKPSGAIAARYAVFGRLQDSRDVVYDYSHNMIHLATSWDSKGYPLYDKEQSLKGRNFSILSIGKEPTAEQQIVGEAKAKYKEIN